MSQAADPPVPAESGQARGVRTPAFRRLWWSWTVSLLGDGVRTLALPLYVAVETGSALAASAVVAAEVLPWLLFALPAGAIVDRVNPKIVIIVAHLVRFALTAGLVVAIVLDVAHTPVLCAFAFLLTLAETFAYSASQSVMVALVGPNELNEANARFYTVHSIGTNLVGPLAAGALFLSSPALAFALDGLTFLVAALLMIGLPFIRVVDPGRPRRSARALPSEIREGVRLLFGVPGLRVLVAIVATATLAASAVNAMTPLFAVEDLKLKPALVSVLMVVGALGLLSGTWLVPRLARRRPEGVVLVGSLAVVALGMIGLGASDLVAGALVANFCIGVGIGAFNVLVAARRQRLTPTSAMGRISGAYRMVAWGIAPVGAGLAGVLAVNTTLNAVFVAAGAVILLALAVLGRALIGRTAPRPTAADAAEAASPEPAVAGGAAAQAQDVPVQAFGETSGGGTATPAPRTDSAIDRAADGHGHELPAPADHGANGGQVRSPRPSR